MRKKSTLPKTTTGRVKQRPAMPKRLFVFNLKHNSPKMIRSEFSDTRYMATGRMPRQITYWVQRSDESWFMHDPRPEYSKPFSSKKCQTRLSKAERLRAGLWF